MKTSYSREGLRNFPSNLNSSTNQYIYLRLTTPRQKDTRPKQKTIKPPSFQKALPNQESIVLPDCSMLAPKNSKEVTIKIIVLKNSGK